MTENRQSQITGMADAVGTRRGLSIYDRNPSVPLHPNGIATRTRPVKIADGDRALIIGKDTGELLGEAHAMYFENETVDRGNSSSSSQV